MHEFSWKKYSDIWIYFFPIIQWEIIFFLFNFMDLLEIMHREIKKDIRHKNLALQLSTSNKERPRRKVTEEDF